MDAIDPSSDAAIVVRGAREHNLRDVTVRFPRGRLTVVTGVSGSGKSSLAFDTLYAEGQRRYAESVSTYARQFLELAKRPDCDGVDGVCPALAIGRTEPPRSARSTVGTVTEIADALRVLWARAGETICPQCGTVVQRDTPRGAADSLLALPRRSGDAGRVALVAFPLHVPDKGGAAATERLIAGGYLRVWLGGDVRRLDEAALPASPGTVHVLVDRVTLADENTSRLVDAFEHAFRAGDGVAAAIVDGVLQRFTDGFHCAIDDRDFPVPTPLLFSFNSPVGACPICRGFGDTLEFDATLVVPDPLLSLSEGAVAPWAGKWRRYYGGEMRRLAERRGFSMDAPWAVLPQDVRDTIVRGEPGFEGVMEFLESMRGESYKVGNRFLVKRYQRAVRCRACHGRRLRPEALCVRIEGRTIGDVTALPIAESLAFFRSLHLPGVRGAAADAVLGDVNERLSYLEEVGLPYLTLDRLARTLSGGEMQRIGLARALGARLTDTLYVLDEPTIGLHARDTDRLLGVLDRLRERGNTVVVVEHDRAVMERADWLVDMGPGAGSHGGRVTYAGPRAGLVVAGAPDSATAPFLGGASLVADARGRRTLDPARALTIRGATLHNLHGVDVDVPLGGLVCVTGVSGSGKSTLVMDLLAPRAAADAGDDLRGDVIIEGLDQVSGLVLVDQTPISRSRRSNPVTFIGAYDEIRALYGAQPEARRRGLTAGSFSFNVAGGRCERCEGEGVEQIEMYWMADVTVECALCGGTRFGPDALAVRYKGRTIHDVLNLTVDDALVFFHDRARVATRLWVLQRVGLGYLTLGQPAPTLSGGEAQRLKIAREMAGRSAPGALYVLDEPTVGLHMADVQRLLTLLHELIDERGASIIVIEHNLDVIASADWVIDLGPEGGEGGGRIVATGPPEAVMRVAESRTGVALRGGARVRQ